MTCLPWQHDWVASAVQHRFEPWVDPLTRELGVKPGQPFQLGSNKTDVLYKCKCGAVKTKTLRGVWKLEDVRA